MSIQLLGLVNCGGNSVLKASRQGSGLARIRALLRHRFLYNRDKNRDSDEKEGQPVRADLLISPLLSDWCGGGDFEPLCLAALAPQASASANFATSAWSLLGTNVRQERV